MFQFEIKHSDKKCPARTGVIRTSHGSIRTPAFVPVATQATVKSLTPAQLQEIGFDSLLGNAYHLYLRPGAKIVPKLGGLHKFMGWDKPLFTDSGGFQVFSLKNCRVNDEGAVFRSHLDFSEHRFTPEKSIQVQQQLGADVIFTFDQCLPHHSSYEETKKAMERTHLWAKRCWSEFQKKKTGQALYGIVQGGRYKELREESARFVSSLNFDGFGLGSLFGEPKEETREMAQAMMRILPEEKPRHFLGIGSIDDFFHYVEIGADTFDCVLPTRWGRLGYFFLTPEGGGKVKNKFRMRITRQKFKEDKSPLDQYCRCYVCRSFSRAYLRHLYKAKELLFYTLATYHNLYFFQKLMEAIGVAIEKDKFLELKKEWLGNQGFF